MTSKAPESAGIRGELILFIQGIQGREQQVQRAWSLPRRAASQRSVRSEVSGGLRGG